MSEERVLCFERKVLDGLGLFQGLSFNIDHYLPPVTSPSHLKYLVRREAEQDKAFKQLIPYVLLISGDRVLHYQRGKGGEESRLHGLYSVGVGGHISDEDQDLFSKDIVGYYDGMWRELREEVDIEPLREAVVAVINDDSSEVGMVHFGVVHVVYVDKESAVGRRKGIVSPQFVPISDAVRTATNYESWSRLCLENIEGLLRKAQETAAAPCRRAA